MNPNNLNHLLAAAILLHPNDQADGPVVTLYSNDHGKYRRVHPFWFKSAADVYCIINEKEEFITCHVCRTLPKSFLCLI